MRTLIALIAAILTLCSCSLYSSDTTAPDPIEQCNGVAEMYCRAEVSCGGGDVAECAASYADACEHNLTIVPPELAITALRTMAAFACDGTAPTFRDEIGITLLAVMTAWPESPTSD